MRKWVFLIGLIFVSTNIGVATAYEMGTTEEAAVTETEEVAEEAEEIVEQVAAEEDQLEETADAAQEEETNSISSTIQSYISENLNEEGAYQVEDTEGNTRNLTFSQFHEGISENEGVSTLCADFTDSASGETIDVDFDVEEIDGSLSVTNARFHKVVETAMAEEAQAQSE